MKKKKSTRSTVNAQSSLCLPSEGTANEKRINMKILQNQNAKLGQNLLFTVIPHWLTAGSLVLVAITKRQSKAWRHAQKSLLFMEPLSREEEVCQTGPESTGSRLKSEKKLTSYSIGSLTDFFFSLLPIPGDNTGEEQSGGKRWAANRNLFVVTSFSHAAIPQLGSRGQLLLFPFLKT